MQFYNTNDASERVSFKTALLRGQAPGYGLYMIDRKEVPKLSPSLIKDMKKMSYAEIALQVLAPFLETEIPRKQLESMLQGAYDERKIPTLVQQITERKNIMWLTNGPTYSFKDYAARFFGRALSHYLASDGLQRTVLTATSGDTGGAVADALHNLPNVDMVVFFPRGSISEEQRRQMTTLQNNIYAFAVNGNFDVCQALSKRLLNDKQFASDLFGDQDRLTSANSISLGRLLPQMVYPFFGYSRACTNGDSMIASVPSGNFGDIMGTILAKEMGLPISKILCGVNDNREFVDFLKTGTYKVTKTRNSPSSAMNVSHPSNLARLVAFYGGHMRDIRKDDGKIVQEGYIERMPDLDEIKANIFAVSISKDQHYKTIKRVHDRFGVIIEPHGAVGWAALERYHDGRDVAVVYETAHPGKFPIEVKRAIGILPETPQGIVQQASMKERTYSILSEPEKTKQGLKLTEEQITEAKEKITKIFKH